MYSPPRRSLSIGSVGICLIPLAIVQGKWSEKIYKEQTKLKDDRVNVANEALGGIKLVKFYSWENPFEERIDNIRQTELKTMRKLKLVRDCGWLLWEIGPFLMERILSFALELIFLFQKIILKPPVNGFVVNHLMLYQIFLKTVFNQTCIHVVVMTIIQLNFCHL